MAKTGSILSDMKSSLNLGRLAKSFISALCALILVNTAFASISHADERQEATGAYIGSAQQQQDIEIRARQLLARDNSEEAIIVLVVQPTGGDAEAYAALDSTLNRSRERGMTIGDFTYEVDGYDGTSLYAYARGVELFKMENVTARDLRAESDFFDPALEDGWERIHPPK